MKEEILEYIRNPWCYGDIRLVPISKTHLLVLSQESTYYVEAANIRSIIWSKARLHSETDYHFIRQYDNSTPGLFVKPGRVSDEALASLTEWYIDYVLHISCVNNENLI